MNTVHHCPECGAAWREQITCRDHFDQMLAWEFEDPGGAGAVHHLTVLCYNLQHPSVYSAEGLAAAQKLLVQFVVDDLSPAQARQQIRDSYGERQFKITGTADNQGRYAFPVQWALTVDAVAAGGLDGYGKRVTAWAKSILAALQESGNFPHD